MSIKIFKTKLLAKFPKKIAPNYFARTANKFGPAGNDGRSVSCRLLPDAVNECLDAVGNGVVMTQPDMPAVR